MKEKRQNILIGSLVASAIVLAFGFLLFIKPSVGDGRKHLRVWFVNIDKINRGTPVTLAGKAIGSVAEIKPITEAREQRIDALGKVYYYELMLKVDSAAQIFDTDAIFIQTSGLLGERNIAITPKHIADRKEASLATESTALYAQSSSSVEDAISEIAQTVGQAQRALAAFADLLTDNKSNSARALEGLANMAHAVSGFVDQLKDQDFAEQISHSLVSLRQLTNIAEKLIGDLSNEENLAKIKNIFKRVESILTALDDPKQWKNLMQSGESALFNISTTLSSWQGHGDDLKDALISAKAGLSQFQQMGTRGLNIAQKWSDLTDRTCRGKGSLGLLLTNDDLYANANLLLGKSNTLVNDINQFGLLFQNNRTWKRARADRVATANQFKDVGAFKAYCDGELDALQTGLSRIEMLWQGVQKQQTTQNRGEFLNQFTQVVKRLNQLQQQLDLMREEMESK